MVADGGACLNSTLEKYEGAAGATAAVLCDRRDYRCD
jgi:hypothetical protein